jgi:phage-related protein
VAGDHIDEAFVDIKPDVKNFDRELNAELTASFKNIERKLDNVVDSIEGQFKHLVLKLDGYFGELTHSVDHAFDSIKSDARGAGRAIATDIEVGTKIAKHAIDDLADDAGRDFARLRRKSHDEGAEAGRGFLGGIFASLSGAGSQISSSLSGVFGGLGSLFGGGGDIVGTLKIAAIAAAVPIVIALAGALSQLLGLLLLIPAAAGVLVAAIAPLIIAFHGFSDAIGAGLSGDTEKFNEALKGLAPSARSVVKEIIGLKRVFSDIKNSVQEAFFAPLVGSVKQLATTLFPALTMGLTTVAGALGKMVRGFIDLLATPAVVHTINELFATTGRIIDNLAPSLTLFIETLFKLLRAGLPWIEKFADRFAAALVAFSDFLANAANSGKFNTWIENAVRVLGELWDLLKAVGGLLKTLFVGTAASGEDFIVKLTEMVNKLNDFFSNTKEGKETVEVLAKSVIYLGTAVLGAGVAFANILRWINEFTHWLQDAWTWVKSVGSAIGDFFVSIGSAVAGAWTTLTGWISTAWNAVVTFFTSLPGRISAALSALPGVLQNAAMQAFDRFFFAVGYGIGTVIAFFRDLPLKVWAILVEFWNGTLALVRSGIDSVVNFFGALPGRVSNFVESMKFRVVTLIAETKNAFISRVTDLVNGAVNVASSLPGRIWNAVSGIASSLYSLGRDMILGMINGIKSAAGALVDAAERAVIDAWNGAKRALHANSPSKLFAKLGKWSVQGYEGGMNDEADAAGRRTPAFPVDVFGGRSGASQTKPMAPGSGGTTLVAYLQIGDDQLHPVMVRTIEEHPQEVALAGERGNTKLDRRR